MSILGDEFDAAVNRLKQAAFDFVNMYRQFVSIEPQYRTANWQGVKDRADYVQGIISAVTNGIDQAYKWAAGTFGLNGLAGLGLAVPMAIPITVGAIGAAVTAIMTAYGYMTEELNKSSIIKRVAETNIARAEQGLPLINPDEVIAQETGIFGDLSSVAKWAAIGAFIVFVAPKLVDKLKRVK